MNISDGVIQDLNTLADWLSVDDFSDRLESRHDLLILAGHAIIPNIFGALHFASQAAIPLLLSGGIGHSTPLLRQAIQRLSLIDIHRQDDRSEAELIAVIATDIFHIPQTQILTETRSTNCGQNADLSRDLLLASHKKITSAILVQDPLMQRRTFESFSWSWRQKQLACTFTSWPVFKPRLMMTRNGLQIIGAQMSGLWSTERYIAMILGEMRRLCDDASGYGPQGSGFIGHVHIPDPIMAAWHRLLADATVASLSR